jgi:YfiH family protein
MAFECIDATNGVRWLRSRLLHEAGVPHGFSTRVGGVSPAPFDTLNLGLADAPGEGDSWERVCENWRRFLQAVGLGDRALVRARQVHAAGVIDADRVDGAVRMRPPFPEGDAIVTGDAMHAISVRVADCAPVLLADPEAGLVAAVHSGWRGTVAGVVPRAVERMLERGARADRMLAAIGPCIGAGAFEVGPEVRDAFEQEGLGGCVVAAHAAGKGLVDLAGSITVQLGKLGLKRALIDVDGGCTVGLPTLHHSHRRDGARSGRASCIIGL